MNSRSNKILSLTLKELPRTQVSPASAWWLCPLDLFHGHRSPRHPPGGCVPWVCSYTCAQLPFAAASIVVQSLSPVWLCDPMDCSTPGFLVLHCLPELTQTHVHWADDAIRPSHPLSSPSPPTFNLSQHQGLFQWVSSSHQVAKVLGASASASVFPMDIQDWFPLGWIGWISLKSKGLSRVFSNTTVQKH